MRIPGSDKKRRDSKSFLEDGASQPKEDASALVDRALGVEWYERVGNEVDFAASALCRLRRARSALLRLGHRHVCTATRPSAQHSF